MDSTITTAWEKGYNALENFNNGSLNVLDTLGLIREEMERINEELREAQESSITDWVEEEDYPANRPSHSGGSSSGSSSNKPWGDKYDGLEEESERAEYRDKQLKKMIALGDEMNRTPSADKDKIRKLKEEQQEIANTIGAYNQGGTWYIMINDKKYKVRDAVGVRHTGIETGFVKGVSDPKTRAFANLLKPTEELNILEAGEMVVNKKQMHSFVDKISKVGGENAIEFNIDNLIKVDKIDNSTDIDAIVNKAVVAVQRDFSNMFLKLGIKPRIR